MAFNMTSFFAGVGTVFAAVMIGFAGGAMITTPPKLEPNRVERVAASTPVVAAKTEAPIAPSVPAAKTETSETTVTPDRVISLPPKPESSQAALPAPQPVAPQPQPVMARDDLGSQIDNAKRAREAELKKEADLRKTERRAQQRRERRKQQEIQAAANAVRQMQANGELRQVSREVSQDAGPRFGFFGDN
jgi:hypothetical protein